MIKPRDYQEAADQFLWNYLHTNHGKNPLVVLATGMGKSLNMAMAKWRLLASYPKVRILNATHVKELVEGNYRALMSLWPSAPAGVYSAGLGRKDVGRQITFCGVQSAVRNPQVFGHIDFVFVDEAHRISPKDEATYGQLFKDLKRVNPNLVVIGFTATDWRMGSGLLTDGDMFDDVVFNLGGGESFLWAIEQGYLIRPVPKDPGFAVDETELHLRGGEYIDSEASQAMRDQNILERAVDMMIAVGTEQNRKAWLTFNQSIDDAEMVADMFRYKGHDVQAVHSKRDDRDEVLRDFKRGLLRGVTNKDVLTTGFDHPPIDLIGILRLMRSAGLWVQMLGRGTRPSWVGHQGHNGGPPLYDISTQEGRLASILASHKQSTTVLDFAGNTRRLGTINYPNVPGKRKKGAGGGDAPVRTCPEPCNAMHHVSVKVCPECGHEFPPPTSFSESASDAPLVESRAAPVLDLMAPPVPRVEEIHGVHRMVCSHNEGKNGKPDTLRVDYFCGMRRFSAWVCLAHADKSFPRSKAEQWWAQHGGPDPAPTDIADATEMVDQLTKPKFIKVYIPPKGYPDIIGYDFRGTKFGLPPEGGGPPLSDPGPDPLARPVDTAEDARRSQMIREMYEDDIPF